MTTGNGAYDGVQIVSIHDLAPQGFLAFDFREVLECLGDRVQDHLWVFTEDIECAAKEPPLEKMLSSEELFVVLQEMQQAVDATLVGIPKTKWLPHELAALTDVSRFPEFAAWVVIRAVDSSFFEVWSKEPSVIQSIKRRFHDVREEPVEHYFSRLQESEKSE